MAPQGKQLPRKHSSTGVTRSESLINYAALSFAVVRSILGMPTHVQDIFQSWSLGTTVYWTGIGRRPDDQSRYRVKGRAGMHFWRVVVEAVAYVFSAARDGATSL